MKERKTIRLKGHDYSQKGYYFVTIEPFDHEYSFCEIIDGIIKLNEIGKIIDDQWEWLFDQYHHIRKDEYVIMPDHFHAIIRILLDSQSNGNRKSSLDPQSNVRATLESPLDLRAGQVPPVHLDKTKRYTLSHMMSAFKSKSSTRIRKAGYKNYKWKRSFHDRIIRKDELEIKRNYIRKNPENWKERWK